jgi:lysine 2,3-aminomutase
MLALHKKLLEMRVRAYYMYDPEIIPGSRGFRTPLAKGYEIIEYMRGKISGMGIPQFVNDLPGGGGKVTLTPKWYYGFHSETRQHLFKSALRGTFHLSPEPIDSLYDETYEKVDLELWDKVKDQAYSVHNG